MTATLGRSWPGVGLAIGLVALFVWLLSPTLRWLDYGCGALEGIGLIFSFAGYLRGRDLYTRQLSVLALGANLFGLGVIVFLYLAA